MAGGHNVYAACVISCNFVILAMQHNWTFLGELLMALQIGSYFGTVLIQAEFSRFFLIYQFTEEYFTNIAAWLGFFLCIVFSLLLISLANSELNLCCKRCCRKRDLAASTTVPIEPKEFTVEDEYSM
jgi:hypothetical protein